MDMPQMWIPMDNSAELPTDSTTVWTMLCIDHISTASTATFYLKNNIIKIEHLQKGNYRPIWLSLILYKKEESVHERLNL
ncbi:MAG: hypothetical protein PHN55_12805 [Dysgonamonadaceae bacterium]|jgi:hypothetical protein|nr:hypothetical protein [Dysgonamonadaceae bacterium]